MRKGDNIFRKLDRGVLFFYFLFLIIGGINIYSVGSSFSEQKYISDSLLFDSYFSKQFIWMCISLVIVYVIFLIDYKFLRYSSIILYVLSIFFILGLLFFGNEVKGATSWYKIGNVSIQPSEFSKFTTAMMFSSIMDKKNYAILEKSRLLKGLFIIMVPVFLILLEPDLGSALTFIAFILVLSMMGHHIYIITLLYTIILFIIGILYDDILIFLGLLLLVIIYFMVYSKKIKSKFKLFIVRILLGSVVFLSITNFIWNDVLKDRHRNRINVVLGIIEDNRGVGYNVYQSKIAIGSGGFLGRGFKKGIYNKGSFVPEQHSDFIFCTIGEEWGFVGSFLFIVLYVLFIHRLFNISRRQNSNFTKIYGYSVTSFIFIHFLINISMTLGLMPVIGIPLPFISYGGSSLLAFTVMLFILLKFDSCREDII